MAIDVNLERPLPHNLDAERSILGAILLDNHALNPAVEKLKTDDFFLDPHRRIFERMIALAEAQHAIDLVTLTEDLHRSGELEAAGGAAYLAQLVDGVPRISNVEHYARIVKEKSMLRNLAHVALAIQERALAADDEADAILDNAESSIFELADDRIGYRLSGIGSRDGWVAAFGADYFGGAAVDGEDGAGFEYCGECGGAESRDGGGV